MTHLASSNSPLLTKNADKVEDGEETIAIRIKSGTKAKLDKILDAVNSKEFGRRVKGEDVCDH